MNDKNSTDHQKITDFLFCCPICKSDLSVTSDTITCTHCGEVFHKKGPVYDFSLAVEKWHDCKNEQIVELLSRCEHAEWFNQVFRKITLEEYLSTLNDPRLREINLYAESLRSTGINMGQRYDTDILQQDSLRDLHELALLDQRMPKNHQKSVAVDLGCGTLRVTKKLLQLGFDTVIAIDLLPDLMLYSYSKLSEEDKRRVILVCADVRHLPIKDKTCDICVAIETFEHIHSPLIFILDVERVLSNNGTAVFNTWNSATPGNRNNISNKGKEYYENGFYYAFYSFSDLKKILDTSGMTYRIEHAGCALGRRLLHKLGAKYGKKILPVVISADPVFRILMPKMLFPFLFFSLRQNRPIDIPMKEPMQFLKYSRSLAGQLLSLLQGRPIYRTLGKNLKPSVTICEAAEKDISEVNNWFYPHRENEVGTGPNIYSFVARMGTHVVGFGQLVTYPDDLIFKGWWIFSMSVKPFARGLGIGRDLTMAIINKARFLGAKELSLVVREGNRQAPILYLSVGFNVVKDPQYNETISKRVHGTRIIMKKEI